MKHPRLFRTAAFGIVLAGSMISFTAVAHADCPAGYQNNEDTNVSTGVTVFFCTPLGAQNFSDYDPNLHANAPVAVVEIAPPPVADVPVVTPDLVVAPPIIDPNDPFPLLAVGDKIPDTFLVGHQVASCLYGSGVALDVNVVSHTITSYCIKTYIAPLVPSLTPVDTTPTVNTIYTTIVTVLNPAISSVPVFKLLSSLAGTSARGD